MTFGYNEADTRAKLIDPAIHKCGWTEDLIRREETAGAVEIIGGKVDYVLSVKTNPDTQPVAVALIEAKIFNTDEEPTPAGLFEKLSRNPDELEEESFSYPADIHAADRTARS